MEGLGHPPRHKTLNLQFVLPMWNRNGGNGQPVTGQAEIHAMRGSLSLTLLMIFCRTWRQEPSECNCHQKGFTQQLMETDVETHSQTLGRAWGILMRGRERSEGARRSRAPQQNLQNQLTWAYRGSQRRNLQPGSLHGSALGPLHIYNSCVGGSSCGTPNNRNRDSL